MLVACHVMPFVALVKSTPVGGAKSTSSATPGSTFGKKLTPPSVLMQICGS